MEIDFGLLWGFVALLAGNLVLHAVLLFNESRLEKTSKLAMEMFPQLKKPPAPGSPEMREIFWATHFAFTAGTASMMLYERYKLPNQYGLLIFVFLVVGAFVGRLAARLTRRLPISAHLQGGSDQPNRPET